MEPENPKIFAIWSVIEKMFRLLDSWVVGKVMIHLCKEKQKIHHDVLNDLIEHHLAQSHLLKEYL